MKKNNRKVINFIVINLSFLILYLSIFIKINFEDVSFEQLLYTVLKSEGSNLDIVLYGFIFILICLIITNILILIPKKIYKSLGINIKFSIKINKKEYKRELLKLKSITNYIILVLLFSFFSFYSLNLIGFIEYYKMQKTTSYFIEDNYVDAKEVNIEFPKEKRNLIYIYVESLESSSVSEANGGIVEKSYIPKLEQLALENINFSNNDKIGGAIGVTGTGWTIAALMAHTSGVPLKLDIHGNDYKGYGESLPGVYNLGDILSENGYKNYLMIGSNAEFGGRKDFFTSHGDYDIYDHNYMINTGKLKEGYNVWWGYEDQKLFKFAKEKLSEISKEEEPFNFTILTADTHFTDGYMDKTCKNVFDIKYANSFYCSDTKLHDFIKWIKKQDFYQNTTIVITGDHLTMQAGFYDENQTKNRRIYNTFINSEVKPINEKNREFTVFDMFPTTLASLNVKIEGNKLGLGVNLFGEEKTLVEEYGIDYINEELAKKSIFYNNVILGDTYYKIKEQNDKKEN